MYPQSSDSAVSAAFPVVVVIAVSTIAAIAIAAWLVRDIACRAIARSNPDKVPAVVQSLAAMLPLLGSYLPWSSQKVLVSQPVPDSPALTPDSADDPEPLEEDHGTQY